MINNILEQDAWKDFQSPSPKKQEESPTKTDQPKPDAASQSSSWVVVESNPAMSEDQVSMTSAQLMEKSK